MYHKDFECKIETVDKIIKATCVLHNYLIDRQPEYLDNNQNVKDHILISVGNRTEAHRTETRNSRNEGYQVREMYCSYFNIQGKVPRQDTRISSRMRKK